MLKNIINLKIGIFFCIAALAAGKRVTQVLTTVLDVHHEDLKLDPFVKVGNKLYSFGQSKETWFKASLICRSMNGFLASFENAEELAELSNYLIAKYPTDRYWWLSGSDLDSEGFFYWYSTGERFSYVDWSGNQPDNKGGNENCVHLLYKNTKYQMNDWQCKQKAYYICEADPPKTVVLSIF